MGTAKEKFRKTLASKTRAELVEQLVETKEQLWQLLCTMYQE